MNLIAHRGYVTKNIKENTMEAFINAFNNDFCGIEFDVRETKDKELVVCHDYFINRVSDGIGSIKDYTYLELLKFNFGSSEVKSKIPLLKDVLIRFNGIKIIELKGHIDINPILNFLDENTYFISFDTSYILKLKKKYPNLKFGILNYGLNSIKDYRLDIICLLEDFASQKLVNEFVKNGVKVFIYGITGNIKYFKNYKDIFYIADKKY